MKPEYSVRIAWSREDEAYIVSIPELPGCFADGATVEEALANARTVVKEWIEVASEEGRKVPAPMTHEDFEKAWVRYQEGLQKHIEAQIKSAVQQIVPQIVANLVQEFSESAPGRLGSVFVGSTRVKATRKPAVEETEFAPR